MSPSTAIARSLLNLILPPDTFTKVIEFSILMPLPLLFSIMLHMTSKDLLSIICVDISGNEKPFEDAPSPLVLAVCGTSCAFI